MPDPRPGPATLSPRHSPLLKLPAGRAVAQRPPTLVRLAHHTLQTGSSTNRIACNCFFKIGSPSRVHGSHCHEITTIKATRCRFQTTRNSAHRNPLNAFYHPSAAFGPLRVLVASAVFRPRGATADPFRTRLACISPIRTPHDLLQP